MRMRTTTDTAQRARFGFKLLGRNAQHARGHIIPWAYCTRSWYTLGLLCMVIIYPRPTVQGPTTVAPAMLIVLLQQRHQRHSHTWKRIHFGCVLFTLPMGTWYSEVTGRSRPRQNQIPHNCVGTKSRTTVIDRNQWPPEWRGANHYVKWRPKANCTYRLQWVYATVW